MGAISLRLMGENHIGSQRAVIALCCPAGTAADGALTSADTTSLRLDVPDATSAPLRIKL